MPTLKQAGSLCPRCSGKCAEYAKLNQSMRWTCNTCGAGGQIEAEPEQAVEEAKESHRHWSELSVSHGSSICQREPLNTTHRFCEAT